MEITVTEIRAMAGGAEAAVSVRICSGSAVQNLKGNLLAEMLMELGLPWEFTSPIAIDKNRCDELIFCIEKTAAIKKGLSLLEYAQNTAKTLKRKLMQKGYSAEAASAAVEYPVLVFLPPGICMALSMKKTTRSFFRKHWQNGSFTAETASKRSFTPKALTEM